MPFYEYECPSCHRQTEVMQKISDKPLKKCPSCGKAGLRKLVSAPVFRLKGSGWYETDFKSDKEGKRNLAGGDDAPAAKDDDSKPKVAAKAGDKAADKAEAKPAAAAEPKAVAKSSSSKSRAKPAAKKAPARKPAAPKRKGGKR